MSGFACTVLMLIVDNVDDIPLSNLTLNILWGVCGLLGDIGEMRHGRVQDRMSWVTWSGIRLVRSISIPNKWTGLNVSVLWANVWHCCFIVFGGLNKVRSDVVTEFIIWSYEMVIGSLVLTIMKLMSVSSVKVSDHCSRIGMTTWFLEPLLML